ASGATERSPLERLLGEVAAKVVHRSVEVRCEGETDWKNLGQSAEWGYVRFWGYTVGGEFRPSYPDSLAELSPQACWNLQQYAKAALKQSKCPTTVEQERTVVRTRRVPEWRTVRTKAGTARKRVWVKRRIPETVTETVPGPPAPCASLPGRPSREYENVVLSLLTVSHEVMHLAGVYDEATAQCHGLQWVAFVARELGADAEDAQSLAAYLFREVYPRAKATPRMAEYYSDECRAGGSLDLTPNDGSFP
ncbi:MAG: hypothetical protein FJ104_13755, partial [Deltaproteobacteria bacterium]|nr:hypothetical protein [Deltaproteobacteria bacterium]